jgi:hypothetical protein
MKTAKEITTTLGLRDADITVAAEINEKEEIEYNQLIIQVSQTDGAFIQETRIPMVTREQILELANNIKKLAKYFPTK